MTVRSWGSKALLPIFQKLWPDIKVQKIGNAGKVEIWTIHGEKLRSYEDAKGQHPFIDFTEGGNWQAYPWLPKNLIVIDADATRGEQELTKLHELGEANEMEEAGDNYDIGKHPAHKYANKIEGKARSDPSQYPGLWQNEVQRRAKIEGDDTTATPETDNANPLLQQTIDHIEHQLTSDNLKSCDRIVVAGMHAALKGGPSSWAAHLAQSKKPVQDAVKGSVNLVLMLRKATKQGTMPGKAMVPAATILMLKALQFAERSGNIKIDETTISKATRDLADYLMRSLGLPPQRMQVAAQKVHAIMNDPQKMAQIHAASGSTPDIKTINYGSQT